MGYVAPWRDLTGEKFMTAVAFERAAGSQWIVRVILASALLSLLKVFNGNWWRQAVCSLPWDVAGSWTGMSPAFILRIKLRHSL